MDIICLMGILSLPSILYQEYNWFIREFLSYYICLTFKLLYALSECDLNSGCMMVKPLDEVVVYVIVFL